MAEGTKSMSKFHNRTRESISIPKKLFRERKFYLIPMYYLLLTSELAREGIKNSGSYRFADHIYGNKPKGKLGIGYVLDALLLNLKSSKSFRNRYLNAKQEIHQFLKTTLGHQDKIKVLAVPSGLARELFEVADELRQNQNISHENIEWYGLDLDKDLIERLNQKSKNIGHKMHFYSGDALTDENYQKNGDYDIILSIGFTEFLDDKRTFEFYGLVRKNLKPGGKFITSGMIPHKFSEYLMKNIAELRVSYRNEDQLRVLAKEAGFTQIDSYQDRYKLQTMLIATKS